MKLVYYKSEPNVGDALNVWLWERLFDGHLNDDPDHIFLGIGTILVKGYAPKTRRITVFGSGARSRWALPDMTGAEWDVRFVRGPLTAKLTGAPYISDPAILLPTMLPPVAEQNGLGFVPHFKTRPETALEAAKRLNARVISPSLGVEDFVAALTSCERVVCEAMHGAIIADAYRIPWAGVRLEVSYQAGRGNVFKWRDWSESLGAADHFGPLPLLCHAPKSIRMRLAAVNWKALNNPVFDLSPAPNLGRAQDRIMDEVARLTAEMKQ